MRESAAAITDEPREFVYEFGPFRLRPDGVLLAAGRVVHLTPTEEAVLTILVQAEGARIDKEVVLERAWPSDQPSDASLARCLHTLRNKLRAAHGPEPAIATSYRRGYRLCVPVRRIAADVRATLRPLACAQRPSRSARVAGPK